MPIYVYVCPECDVLVEERRPLGAADFPPVECPVCHGLCEQQMATFSINRGAAAPEGDGAAAGPEAGHPPGCPCCADLRYPAG